jgi:hypothetical protein
MADTPETRIKVFISYSRADKAFASDLVLGLAACGFAPYIDRQDIAAGEDWERRLAGLITEADSVVYVISPDSLGSENCAEEFRQALKLQKRILPVVWRAVDDAAAPPEMKRLNYIFFTGEGRTFATGLAELAEALRTNIDWIREHTRLAEQARRWFVRGRPVELLLRGDDIDTATAWMTGKPITAPTITDEQADFIKASADARAEADRRAKRARSRLVASISAVAVAMTGLAAVAGIQWRAADESEGRTRLALVELEASTQRERAAQQRLNLPIGLRVAASTTGQFYAAPGWYRLVSDFFGALVQVKRTGGDQYTVVSGGMLVDGAAIHSRYAGEALLLVPAGGQASLDDPPTGAPLPGGFPEPPPTVSVAAPDDTLAPDAPMQPQTMLSDETRSGAVELEITYTSLDGNKSGRARERVWRTPVEMGGVFPFELWRLADSIPDGARAVSEADISCISLEGAGPGRSIGQFSAPVPAQDGSRGPATVDVAYVQDMSDPYKIIYGHGTSRVSGGSPVFDFTTGKAFAAHIGSEPDPSDTRRRRGFGISLPLVLNIARSELADAESHLPPLCEG